MISRALAAARRLRGGRQSYDVVFHKPWVGLLITTRPTLPAGGAETQVLLLARALVERGLRVAIIVFGAQSDLPTQVEGISIVRRTMPAKRRLFVGKVFDELKIWPALWRAPSRVVVHRGGGPELGLVALYAHVTGRKLVFASANVVDFAYEEMTRKKYMLIMYNLGVRLADEVVVQTEEQVSLCEAKFGRRPILIRSMEPLAEPQAAVPEAFVWVGRLVSYKRPLEYVELARALPEARFWMVGVPMPHHKEDRLVMEAVNEGARAVPNLEVLEPRPHGEVQSLMARAVASVNTAEYEGMPNVLLEAWCRGVPALVLSHDPDNVVARYGLGGCAKGSRADLVELAREQWVTRSDRAAVAERCRGYIAQHHSPTVVAQQWLDLFGQGTSAADELAVTAPEPTCAG
jgi:glycosyltransferase involved in cell wall biosynthesis